MRGCHHLTPSERENPDAKLKERKVYFGQWDGASLLWMHLTVCFADDYAGNQPSHKKLHLEWQGGEEIVLHKIWRCFLCGENSSVP